MKLEPPLQPSTRILKNNLKRSDAQISLQKSSFPNREYSKLKEVLKKLSNYLWTRTPAFLSQKTTQ